MEDYGIRTLLDLDGHVLDQEDGYWIKIDAWPVTRSAAIPHGIRYSLTLHAPDGTRLLGYDNAHAVRSRPGRHAGYRVEFDHLHGTPDGTATPYEFCSTQQLLSDFFAEVDQLLERMKTS